MEEKAVAQAVRGDPITFAVPGDLHLTGAGQENYRAGLQAVEEIGGLIDQLRGKRKLIVTGRS